MTTTAKTADHIIDVESVVVPDRTTTRTTTGKAAVDTVVVADGDLVDGAGTALSRVPTGRMAAAPNWDRIVRAIQDGEAGRRTDDEVVVRPGGELDLVPRGHAPTELSRVTKDRMAAGRRAADDAEIRRLDPAGREGWRWIDDPVLPGYTFVMRPIATAFSFFAFRWTSGRWYVSPLVPAFDTLIGHESHVINLDVGGDRVPIICKAANEFDHRNLLEVRGTAGKFATYHSFREAGYTPFSA